MNKSYYVGLWGEGYICKAYLPTNDKFIHKSFNEKSIPGNGFHGVEITKEEVTFLILKYENAVVMEYELFNQVVIGMTYTNVLNILNELRPL